VKENGLVGRVFSRGVDISTNRGPGRGPFLVIQGISGNGDDQFFQFFSSGHIETTKQQAAELGQLVADFFPMGGGPRDDVHGPTARPHQAGKGGVRFKMAVRDQAVGFDIQGTNTFHRSQIPSGHGLAPNQLFPYFLSAKST